MAEKRYYWLKLYDDFFGSLRIKKLRKLAGGDTYTIIYLKLQLLAIHNEGIVQWKGVEDNVIDELALELDEEPENVSVTLQYLLSNGLAETEDSKTFFFPWAVKNTGSETSAAQRMRDSRSRKAGLCNNVTPMLQDAEYCYREKEKDKDKDLESESEKERLRRDDEPEYFSRIREIKRRLDAERQNQ